MEKLQKSDFNWHKDQPDVPELTAEGMKQFFDAPVRVLMAKINEVIGEDGSMSTAALKNLIEETKMETSAEIDNALDQYTIGDLAVHLQLLRDELQPQIKANADRIAWVENYNGIDHEEFYNSMERVRESKQDKLTAGDNITIDENNVISAKGEEVDLTGYVKETDLERVRESKQDKLTAGDNITIDENNVISAAGETITELQDIVTSDMPEGRFKFIDPEDDTRTGFSLYVLEDNGYGAIEPGSGLEVEAGSVGIKAVSEGGYLIIVFRANAEDGYVISNFGGEDRWSEMNFSKYVKNTDVVGREYTCTGLVTADRNSAGPIYATENGMLQLGNNKARIANKGNANAIRNCDLDYAIKVGLTANTEEWSDEEKAAARELLGIADSGEGAWQTLYSCNGETEYNKGITLSELNVTKLRGWFQMCAAMGDHESPVAYLELNGVRQDITEYCGYDATMQDSINAFAVDVKVISRCGRNYAEVTFSKLYDTGEPDEVIEDYATGKTCLIPLGESESITELELYAEYQMPNGEYSVSPLYVKLELEGA